MCRCPVCSHFPLEKSQNQIQMDILEKLENLLSTSWISLEAKSAAYPLPLKRVLNFGQVSETAPAKFSGRGLTLHTHKHIPAEASGHRNCIALFLIREI